MKKLGKIIYSMIVILLLIVAFFVIPVDWTRPFFLILAFLGLAFLILGGVLIWMGRKEKGKLKLWMMVTGFAAMSPLVFSILHNVLYALAMTFKKMAFIFEPLHALSLIISVIIAPIAFIVGVIGIFITGKGKL